MTFKRKIPTEDEEKIKERLLNSETYQNIADTYGVSRERIRQYAKKLDLQGYGMRNRSEKAHEDWLSKMKSKYGHHFDGTYVTDKDFLSVCLEKYRTKKAQVKSSNRPFEVEFSNIIWNRVCPILGIKLDYFAEGRQENSPSFDCISSSLHYTNDNVQIISWRANRIKNNGTAEEHLLIYNYLKNLESK